MPDGTLQILGLGTSPAPLEYLVPGNQPLDLVAVKADFDGSGSGTSFVPVVEILSDASHIMATAKGSTVAAGASATVTFATFLGGAGSDSAGGGIQFDFDNEGGALFLHTRDSGFSTVGFFVNDESADGILLQENANGPIVIEGTGSGQVAVRQDGSGQLLLRNTGDGGLNIQNDGDGATLVNDFGSGGLRLRVTNANMLFRKQSSDNFVFDTLPTSAPATSGAIWNNAGVVNIVP